MVLENPRSCLNFERIIPDLISYRKFIKFLNVSVLSFVWADNNNCLNYSLTDCKDQRSQRFYFLKKIYVAWYVIFNWKQYCL